MNLPRNISDIKAIVLDVDGVLTDGRIGYGGGSPREIKFFDVRDGQGIRLAIRAGLRVGILSGRKSQANRIRAKELGLSFLYEGCLDKLAGWEQMLADLGLKPEECMYIGDDVVDMPPMRRAGFPVAVADAAPELDSVAMLRTQHFGGRGAVREAIEILLKGQGKWDSVLEKYML
ncbi:MAG: HAD hydrolase family protein [Lentisphaeria bacterium]|nr:HAD hydrolase family protein [Lentisphaeria bacterium]